MKATYSRQQFVDKENNSEVCNQNNENNKYNKLPTQKLKHQHSLPADYTSEHSLQAFKDTTNMQNMKTDDVQMKDKEAARKLNAEKVKRNLNENINVVNDSKVQLRKSYSNNVYATSTSNPNNKNTINNSEIIPSVPEFHIGDFKPVSKAQYYDQENKNLVKFYSSEILSHMKYKERETTPCNAMENHSIPVTLRAKMVDWMIEVLSSYKCTEQTFFLAVRLMDIFFQRTTRKHEISDLHLVGVTTMFIACKYEEIYPMKLQVVYDKIAHKKLPIEVIKQKEAEILAAINFEIIGTTPYELAMHVLYKSGLKESLETKIYNYLVKICIYLSKMILYDYELIQNRQYALLSGALIFVAFKIIEQIDVNFKAEEQVKMVIKILNVQHDTLIETAAKILTLAKSFDKLYPQLENLKKFNGFSLDDTEKK